MNQAEKDADNVIAEAAKGLAEIVRRFPEFEEIALNVAVVDYYDDEGGFHSRKEPALLAKADNGAWLNAEEDADVMAMNGMLPWSREFEAVVRRLARQGGVILSGATDDEASILRKLSEGVVEVASPQASLSL